jgi:plastocyanin
MRRVPILLALMTATAALVAAGCGGGNDNNDNSGRTDSSAGAAAATSTPSTPAEDGEGGKSTEVRLQNIAFSPTSISAKVGQEIEWENYDTVAHNVVATSGASFKSATLNKGDKFTFKPTKAGTISYVCTFHPNMKAQISVTQ